MQLLIVHKKTEAQQRGLFSSHYLIAKDWKQRPWYFSLDGVILALCFVLFVFNFAAAAAAAAVYFVTQVDIPI